MANLDGLDENDILEKKRGAKKNLMAMILLVLFFVGVGGSGYLHFVNLVKKAEYDADLNLALLKFTQEMPHVTHIKEDKPYQAAVMQTVRKYRRDIKKLEQKYAKYPDLWDQTSNLKLADEKIKKGHITAERKERFKKAWDFAKAKLDSLFSGEYNVMYSSRNNGFSFDIVKVDLEKDNIILNFNLWGTNKGMVYKSLDMEILNENGNKFAETKAEGAAPARLAEKPRGQIKQFPALVQYGHYEFPRFPRIAKFVNISFNLGFQTNSGVEVPVTFKFEKLQIPEGWYLQEGIMWAGKSEEELKEVSDYYDKEAEKQAKLDARKNRKRSGPKSIYER